MSIDESNVEKIRRNQAMRDEMRKHGFTEVIDGVYSDGTIKGTKMAVVHVRPAPDETIEQACASAIAIYNTEVRS